MLLFSTSNSCCLHLKASVPNAVLFLVLLFILPLVACPLWGQVVQKRNLTPSDYKLWSEMHLEKVSPNDQYISYRLTQSYTDNIDTLFVRDSYQDKTYPIPNGKNSVFTQNNIFVCLNSSGLNILNPKTGKHQIIKDAITYEYSKIKDHLLILNHSPELKDKLIIQAPEGNVLKVITDVYKFSLSPDQENLICCVSKNNEYSILHINLKSIDKEHWLSFHGKESYENFTWQKQGKSVAFISKADQKIAGSLFYYNLETKKIFNLNHSVFPNALKEALIPADSNLKLTISNDLKRVLFSVKYKNTSIKNEPDSLVEIWNGNDKWVYTDELMNGQFSETNKIAVWAPLSQKVYALTTAELPKIILSADQRYALLSNPKQYEPQFEMDGPRDYYLVDLQTMEKKLLLKKQSAHYTHVVPSPQGNYIAYFKDNNWWMYDITQKTHCNLTGSIGVKFTAKEQLLQPESVCGNPGWSMNDKKILLYDQYDIWSLSPDGSSSERLTRGRESKIIYRIAAVPEIRLLQTIYDGLKISNYNLDKELILRGEGEDGKTGYFIWKNNLSLESIVYKNAYIDELSYAGKKKNMFYREQNFDYSPAIMVNKNKLQEDLIYQSNPQQKKFFWGTSELIRYQNSKGTALKGVLLYPANYDPKVKYPMIVSIYELQHHYLHRYTIPSQYNETGFNATVATLKGYYVLLPDIIHDFQNPGISALDCVTAATKKVIDKGIINSERIALIGHSFGGFETAYIASRTNLFRTAIASGGIMDLTSFFLTLGQSSGKPDMYRFQEEQWVMGGTPFDIPSQYQKNSPLSYIEKLDIPLLLWTGKQDEQVDPHQSMEYYLAMRRLGKKNIMLRYANEGHAILGQEAQIDLTNRIQDWFAYYLKDNQSAFWIKNGTM